MVAPPGFSTPDQDGDGSGGGGWSTDSKIAAVVGGLLVVAVGLAALAFAYWRGTRPAIAGAAAELDEDEVYRPTGTVPASMAATLAVAGTATADDLVTGPVSPPIGADPATVAAEPVAGTSRSSLDPLALLLAEEGLDEPGPVAPPEPAVAAPSSTAPSAPVTGPVEPVPSVPAAPVAPAPVPPARVARPAPSPAASTAAEPAAPVQSKGVRIVGPVEPKDPPPAAEPENGSAAPAEQPRASGRRTPADAIPDQGIPLVTREDLGMSDAPGGQ